MQLNRPNPLVRVLGHAPVAANTFLGEGTYFLTNINFGSHFSCTLSNIMRDAKELSCSQNCSNFGSIRAHLDLARKVNKRDHGKILG